MSAGARIGLDADLRVKIGELVLRNPIMPASGCFGPELGRLIPVEEIAAAVTKTVFHGVRGGNIAHRLTEVSAGMVNSVGIPSRGPAGYLSALHGQYEALPTPTIISVGGHSVGEYADVVHELAGAGAAYELNVSCPNLERDGTDIGADPDAIIDVVTGVRRITDKPLIVKLPAMVSSIAVAAQAAESAGADAVTVSNSIPAMPLAAGSRRPALGNIIGGLSGPSVRPIVTRLVWLASRAVKIPVIACGGAESADDVMDYVSVGAAAVQIGTANFSRPHAMVEIVREIEHRCMVEGATSIQELIESEGRKHV